MEINGQLVALGNLPGDDGMHDRLMAWSSDDGVSWGESDLGIDGGIQQVVVGEAGALALVRPASEVPELWHASPGEDFERVDAPPPLGFWATVAAGPEGFVAVAIRPSADSDETAAFASSDGRTWSEADVSPVGSLFVAPLGTGWVAMGPGQGASTASWTSADGLRWTESGTVELRAAREADLECRELIRDVIAAGDVVVAPTTFSYPCSEGRVERFGQVFASTDGAAWSTLPFAPSAVGAEPGQRGTTVRGAARTDAGLVLVGESDGRATFWLQPTR